MTPAELRDQIVTKATDIAKKSSSPDVDRWAAEIQALAAEILSVSPTIVERRLGERRILDRGDGVQGMRRNGQRTGRRRRLQNANVGTVVDRLTITSGDPPGLNPTDTFQMSWVLDNAGTGTVFSGSVTFASSDTNVATVSVGGLITAVAGGTATITATGPGGITDTVPVTVAAVSQTPASIVILSTDPDLLNSQTVVLAAEVRDAGDVPLTGQTVTWSSGTTSVATVSADDATLDPRHLGTVTAHSSNTGTSVITATSGIFTDTVTATVTALQADFPNLPAGLSLVSDVVWDNASKLPPTASYDPATRWRRETGVARVSIGSGSSVAGLPTGPFGDTVMLGSFPAGFNNGVGTAPFRMGLQIGAAGSTVYKKLYMKLWFALDPNWENITPGSGDVCPGPKIGFILPTSNSVTKHHVFWSLQTNSQPYSPPESRLKFAVNPPGGGVPQPDWSVATSNVLGRITRGDWHEIEVYVDVGTAGASDGTAKIWNNGTLVIDRTNWPITPTGAPSPGIRGVDWQPTVCSTTWPQQTWMAVARWAVYVGN